MDGPADEFLAICVFVFFGMMVLGDWTSQRSAHANWL
jgi:hypothetical protein